MKEIKFILSTVTWGRMAYLSYLWLKSEVLLILTALVAIDIITWIRASLSIDQKSVKSSIAMGGIMKKLGIIWVPFVLAMVMKGVGYWGAFFIDTVLGFIIIAEAYSAISNYYSIRKGERVQEIDAIGLLLKWIQKQMETTLTKRIEQDQELEKPQ